MQKTKKYNIYIYHKNKNTIANRFYNMNYLDARCWIIYCQDNKLDYTLTYA